MPHGGNHAFSGARARLYFNGNQLAGWCTGVRGTENIQLQRVDVLGDIDSQEIEPVARTVTMTADFVRILGDSLQAQGLWPQGGTPDVVNFPEMSAVIFDEIDQTAVYTLEGVKCESRNFQVDRQGIMTLNATFQARKLHDETGA
jgi:hypothetical protein